MQHQEMVNRIEHDVWAFQRLLARSPSVSLHETQDLLWLAGSLDSPLCNGVFRAHVDPARVDGVIDSILDRHAELRSPLSWWIGPSMRPADLPERLIRRGFRQIAEEPGMALEISTRAVEHARLPGFEIVPVTDEETLDQWIGVAGDGDPVYAATCGQFGVPDCFAGDGILRFFVGRLDGKPVATSLLFTGSGVASVQNVITLPAARRRGFGAAMTLAAVQQGRERGFDLAVLTATPMAAGIYESIGFRRYCSFTILQHDGPGSTR